ncbi:hypothetical protein AUEXF2481DRAFT_24911 [Aureobasidium subglaciale EXF-2481]|uniref:Mitochondrial fission process protein 1 n=1 Tax=Aureobasidium subglaciale (strain EXF-2481) TaxID=1043005 RepID=A0A074Z2U8_AURSE|nr:uncharacterized protein AUEXF2481DRAFT_24911 [Aureobasidium subglaciale EXF-2481]KAI5199502.1 hypothetical protein E4T38_07025 [Aureobasidium subglaciale]KAI5218393.1 hypothetical protein E4T40_06956 [Aureobasidium subglaciale]KAI5221985.1 hypothetical protein E4T41_06876 [Aureobasidium subglaciale]KAI5259208.1 hypothetical protein E4T46_06854 [Aureobasidium subglaciale]KER00603.1 hypothetical protein AUEXF2481DRAFT_24911 [Aureobasidium subglaciale EXF-2481]
MSDDKKDNSKILDFNDVPRERSEPRPDFSKPLPRKRLPAALQDTLDNEEKLWETMYEGHAQESTESSVRYAAYASRVRTILMSAHRYVAYTSDIGESFRPIAHPYLVKGAYGVSWAYLIGDVSHEGYKAYIRNQHVLNPETYTDATGAATDSKTVTSQLASNATSTAVAQTTPGKVPLIEDYRTVMVQRAIFQGVASMGLPAFTIHSIVKYAGKALKDNKNVKLRTWGPIGLGLAAVPALPFMFDEPVETAVEWVFHKACSAIGGEEAVHGRPETGRSALSQIESKVVAAKEKEL